MSAGIMIRSLTVLIPTYERPAALAVTLTSLCSQTYADFDVVISDQSESGDPLMTAEVQTAIRLLVLHGHDVRIHKHLPRQGIAEHRQFLLDQSNSFFVLFLDDDLILEPDLITRLMQAMSEERCGFVGSAPIGLSYRDEEQPHQQVIEFWDGPVEPETVTPESPAWQRHHLHSAANILHLQQRMPFGPGSQRKYRVAWIGACVLYDAAKLRDVGAFTFWKNSPRHITGEEVFVQTRLLKQYGGCGIIPSGVYHQELPTTIPDRSVNAAGVFSDRTALPAISIEVAAGELVDKITILEIKAERITEPAKLAHVREELVHLNHVRNGSLPSSDQLERLTEELRNVNLQLWQIEDGIRKCEAKKEFGEAFIGLARSVYQQNDRRAAIKRAINDLTGSRLVEEKSYADYEAA